ncbi:MAG: DsrE/DsrF/DrsH-like family protein [Rhodospirillales bacterium]
MPADTVHTPLSVVVYDGHYDKVHYALAMAAAAAAIDRPVTLFFTMDACRALMTDESGTEAWRAMPTTTGELGGAMDARFQSDRIASFEELLESCIGLDVAIMVCEMGLKARGLASDSLRPDVTVEPGGLVTFLAGPAKDGQLVFI